MMIAEQAGGAGTGTPPPDVEARFAQIRARGYEVMPSGQTSGVYNLSAPILGPDGNALAALTCPSITPLGRPQAPDIPGVIQIVVETASTLSEMIGGVRIAPGT